MSKEKTTTDRESPTYAGLLLSLKKYRDRLMEQRHYVLNVKPREIDVRIIDKTSQTAERMDNAIAHFFERHNIIELKNPVEPLDIDTVWKGISYAAQYKSSGKDDLTGKQRINAVPVKDVTLTFLRLSKPTALLKELKQSGYQVNSQFPGVYRITGMVDIKMQIVVGKELQGEVFMPLRVQGKNTDVADAEKLIMMVGSTEKGTRDMELVEAILQASAKANKNLYKKLRKEMPDMCDALREIMQEDLEERYQAGVRDARKIMQEDLEERYQAGVRDVLDYLEKKGYGQNIMADLNSFVASRVPVKNMV